MWELERYDWSSLRAVASSAAAVPDAIRRLLEAETEVDARAAYWGVDNVVIVQGSLVESALPATSCLVSYLGQVSDGARVVVLELLVQLASGEPDPTEIEAGNVLIGEHCRFEILLGAGTYFRLLEIGTFEEKFLCADLLGICAGNYAEIRPRVSWHLHRMMSEAHEDRLREYLAEWIEELGRVGDSGNVD